MTFGDSISTCLSKYATFRGRASRSEYWFFQLFGFLVQIGFIIAFIFLDASDDTYDILSIIICLAFFLPNLSVLIRRLHDIDRSGWFLLIILIPFIGIIMILCYTCIKGTDGPNRFGEPSE